MCGSILSRSSSVCLRLRSPFAIARLTRIFDRLCIPYHRDTSLRRTEWGSRRCRSDILATQERTYPSRVAHHLTRIQRTTTIVSLILTKGRHLLSKQHSIHRVRPHHLRHPSKPSVIYTKDLHRQYPARFPTPSTSQRTNKVFRHF